MFVGCLFILLLFPIQQLNRLHSSFAIILINIIIIYFQIFQKDIVVGPRIF